MRALEFKSKIKNNRILIPNKLLSEFKTDKDIKVIVLFDDTDKCDDLAFKQASVEQFLNGYADSDAIYDN